MKTESLANALYAAKSSCLQLSDQCEEDQLYPIFQLIKECENLINKEIANKEKQMVGMQEAKRNGVHFGRPGIPCSQYFIDLVDLQIRKKITADIAAKKLGISRTAYYNMKKRYRKEIDNWRWKEI